MIWLFKTTLLVLALALLMWVELFASIFEGKKP